MQTNHTKACIIIAAISLLLIVPIQSAAAQTDAGAIDITNLSGTNFHFTYEQLAAMPKTTVYAELYCYGFLVVAGNWGGIPLGSLLDQANITAEVASVQFTASDGYHVTLPISFAKSPDVIIAYELDGHPLTEGYRLVLPENNGDAWISQITSIIMLTTGASNPSSLSVAVPSTQTPNTNRAATPTPQPTTSPTPTPQTSPSKTPTPTPNNGTNQNQPAPTQTSVAQNLNQQNPLPLAMTIGAAAAVIVVSVSVLYVWKSKKSR